MKPYNLKNYYFEEKLSKYFLKIVQYFKTYLISQPENVKIDTKNVDYNFYCRQLQSVKNI